MNRYQIFILARVQGISTMVLVRPVSPLQRLNPWISLFMILLWGNGIPSEGVAKHQGFGPPVEGET
jgi:hypothetical protein